MIKNIINILKKRGKKESSRKLCYIFFWKINFRYIGVVELSYSISSVALSEKSPLDLTVSCHFDNLSNLDKEKSNLMKWTPFFLSHWINLKKKNCIYLTATRNFHVIDKEGKKMTEWTRLKTFEYEIISNVYK